ncbi:MAG: hypothetical protein JXR75_01735 [Rhodobacteraceae bacterium]|nr:hypothetical protein [Paracoccaceae bacterium]
MSGILIVCPSNSDTILAANLARSPLFADGAVLHIERGAGSGASACNRALDAATQDIVVIAHQDVFLPKGWDALFKRRLANLTAQDPNWALAGAYGVAADQRQFGPVWSSSLGQIIGLVPLQPQPVISFDEMLLVVRRSSGLRFDESQPGWHLYGTDIACTARSLGLGAYAVGLPCVHNDRFHAALGVDFTESYRWMQAKWPQFLPIQTPVTKISRSGLHLLRERWNMHKSRHLRAVDAVDTGVSAPELAARCGWADLSASAAFA